MTRLIQFVSLILLLCTAGSVSAQSEPKQLGNLELKWSDSDAEHTLDWRRTGMAGPFEPPQITATLNDLPLNAAANEFYDGNAVVLFVIDATGETRGEETGLVGGLVYDLIGQPTPNITKMAGFAAGSFIPIAVAEYPSAALGEMMTRPMSVIEEAPLSSTYEEAMTFLDQFDDELDRRKEIVLFSDGYDSANYEGLDEVAALARSKGVYLSFVQVGASRDAELPVIDAFVTAAGGQFVVQDDIGIYAQAPFALVYSGGRLTWTADSLRFWPWQSPGDLVVNVTYQENSASFDKQIPVLAYGVSELVALSTTVWPLLLTSGVVGVLVTLAFTRRRKPKTKGLAATSAPVPSTVTFQAILPDGTRVAVSDEWAIVGRHASNDIVLTDGSVSRKHAKVRRTGSSFEIVDLGSSNGTHYSGDHILPSIEIALALGETHRVDFGTVTVIFGLKG